MKPIIHAIFISTALILLSSCTATTTSYTPASTTTYVGFGNPSYYWGTRYYSGYRYAPRNRYFRHYGTRAHYGPRSWYYW